MPESNILLPSTTENKDRAMPRTPQEDLLLRIEMLERENRELKKARKARDGFEKYLLEIIDHTPAPIYLKDKEGRYLLINKEYERLSYTTREAIIGRNDYDIFPESIAALFQDQDEEVKVCGSALEFEETITLPDGEFTFITSKFPLCDADGAIYAVGGFCTDITERRKIEQEKENLIRRLQQTLEEVKTLRGIIPICSFCKKIRDDKGFWSQVETYVSQRTGADFSHALCPSCVKEHYPELLEDGDE